MDKSDIAGGVVVGPKGKILVVNQNNNSWSLPKGQVEKGENELTAAKREIHEEAGIEEKNRELIKDLGSYKRTRISKNGKGEVDNEIRTRRMYLFKTSQIESAPIDPENPEARWVEIDKVSSLLTHKKDKEFFDKIKDKM